MRGTPGHGSLMEWGISYQELPLNPDGGLDWEGLATAIIPGKTRVAHIQRSCGYALRPTLTVQEIGRAVQVGITDSMTILHHFFSCSTDTVLVLLNAD